MNIGQNIRNIRKDKKLTLKQIGIKLGMSEQAIGQYERGERQIAADMLPDVAAALGCTMNDLLGLNITDDDNVREFLYDDNQNRLIAILKIYGYKVYEKDNIFRIVKDDTLKEISADQFDNAESFLNECINFILNN